MKRLLLLSLAMALAFAGWAGLSQLRGATAVTDLQGEYLVTITFAGQTFECDSTIASGGDTFSTSLLTTDELLALANANAQEAGTTLGELPLADGTTLTQALGTEQITTKVFTETVRDCRDAAGNPVSLESTAILICGRFDLDGNILACFEFGFIILPLRGEPITVRFIATFLVTLDGFLDGQFGSLAGSGTITKEPLFGPELPPTPVGIDIKPGSDPNSLRVNDGVVSVAILGSASLDVNDVDLTTCSFIGAAVNLIGKKQKVQASFEDVNGDGLLDVTPHFDREALTLVVGQTTGTLSCSLFNGTQIEGSDSLRVIE